MAVENNGYLSHVTESLARLLGEILGEKPLAIFRRSPQVLLTAPGPTSADYHLVVLRREMLDEDGGSFTSSPSADHSLVFRNPTRLRVSYLLASPALSPTARLSAYDRLTTFFFDNRSLAPFVPSSLETHPALAEKLRAQKAELRMTEPHSAAFTEALWLAKATQGFSFGFDYTALYHSGNPLREERRVRTRVIDFPTHEQNAIERSMQ